MSKVKKIYFKFDNAQQWSKYIVTMALNTTIHEIGDKLTKAEIQYLNLNTGVETEVK